jgi:hypothetical protein
MILSSISFGAKNSPPDGDVQHWAVGSLAKNDLAIHKSPVRFDAMKDSLKLHPVLPSADGCVANSIHTEDQGRMHFLFPRTRPQRKLLPPSGETTTSSPQGKGRERITRIHPRILVKTPEKGSELPVTNIRGARAGSRFQVPRSLRVMPARSRRRAAGHHILLAGTHLALWLPSPEAPPSPAGARR